MLRKIYEEGKTNQIISQMTEIADEMDVSLPHLSLAWVNSYGFQTSFIVGATSRNQLGNIIDGLDINLDENTLTKLNEISDQHFIW